MLILQDALNALGYSTKTLDGIFGANTESALRAFQRSNGLTADGICAVSYTHLDVYKRQSMRCARSMMPIMRHCSPLSI